MTHWRFDSLANINPQAAVFFDRELTDVRRELKEDKMPELHAFDFFPQDTSLDEGAANYIHKMYSMVGIATMVSDYADDLPLVDIAAREETFNNRRFGCAYQHSLDEILASARIGMKIDRKRGKAARRITLEKHNALQFFGDGDSGLFGWANYPNIPREWFSKKIDSTVEADDIIAMINDACTDIFERTNEVAQRFAIRMPSRPFGHIASRRIPDLNVTILKYLLENNAMITEITSSGMLTGAGPNGEDVILIYPMDEDFGVSKTSKLFRQHAPQDRNLTIRVNCTGKSGSAAIDRVVEASICYLPKED